jgi:dTDP-4-amino-4,6-dideoxygalactose transaminase
MGCFSFFTNKNLSVGEGGMFVTRAVQLHGKARYLRSHGMTALTLDRHEGRSDSYDVVQPGLNYRMDEIRAALGLVQLAKLSEGNHRRRELVKQYRRLLRGVPGVYVPFSQHDFGTPSYHIFPVLLDNTIDRARIIAGLKANRIQCSIHYPPFHEFTAYRESNLSDTPIARDISKRELTLPLFPTMTFDQVELVCSVLEELLTREHSDPPQLQSRLRENHDLGGSYAGTHPIVLG